MRFTSRTCSQVAVVIKLNEKSRECHNHNPQPTSNIKRKRKRNKSVACKINIQMHKKHIDQIFSPQAR